ncbi:MULTISPECIES: UDP-N-acetylmuramoyl-L-alanyl-D-glutamate--2,6-diaminopimelate ligase [unclassified Thioalkalivibrio]|uniref:UDP-N-acetylmuramoyl-L-alanyl-D-glutamate--2, 6-diaminopimelate ligase n=1 Tax=unclassified Thioalkalivibrio TaxID=2621013 RepID=UPI000361A5F4|nr:MULTISPECIES: UDP-N-acetylmuramoyl-L-alanyl-D-glutamate--2,6-diaminopimelate ligase [unclassified Thioalkalivibrio]
MMAANTVQNVATLGSLWPAGAPALPLEVAGQRVTDLAQDSRRVTPGAVFVALRGTQGHGLAHARAAAEQGAVAILWDEAEAAPALSIPVLHLPGLRAALPAICDALWGAWPTDYPVVAVTGTDGKTSVSQLLAGALEQLGAPTGVVGTLGVGRLGALEDCGHTTPGVIDLHRHLAQLAADGCRALSIEASSHGLEQGRMAGLPVRVAVLTRLGSDHLDFHGSQQAYADAKARLFAWPGLETAVLNADDALGQRLIRETTAEHILTYSAVGASADLVAREVQAGSDGIRFTLEAAGEAWPVQAALFGLFQVGNLLATLAALRALGHSWQAAVDAVSRLRGVPGRMERFELPSGALLVVDYAHTEQALAAALDALRPHTAGRLIVVFGCGGDRDVTKRPAMGRAASARADQVIVTDDNPRSEDPAAIRAAVLAGCDRPEACRELGDREAAVRAAVAEAGPGDVILLAGKGHETTQQVGTQFYPFSDRELARELAARTNAGDSGGGIQ